MELTLKELAPFHPYDLKWTNEKKELFTMFALSTELIQLQHEKEFQIIYWEDTTEKYEFKPLLLPLSKLTKEIEHNGERFVPMDWLAKNEDCDNDLAWLDHVCEQGDDSNWLLAPYWMMQKLFEWHFDVFQLLDNNLAIDKSIMN